MSEFTRGSWFSVRTETKAGKHRRTRIYCGVRREDGTLKTIATLSGTAAETKADARLITAAPEMYDLLKTCADQFNHIGFSPMGEMCEELLARIDGKEDVDE